MFYIIFFSFIILPLRLSILFVKPGEAAVVFRLGKYIKTYETGTHIIVPMFDKAILVKTSARNIVFSDIEISDMDGKVGKVSLSLTIIVTEPHRTVLFIEDLDRAIQEITIEATKDFTKIRNLNKFGLELENLELSIKNKIEEVSSQIGFSLLMVKALDFKTGITKSWG